MLKDQTVAKSTISKMAGQPESFGALKGKSGLLASRADKQDRERAERNVPALAQSLGDYMRQRSQAEQRYQAEEVAVRRKVSIDIPRCLRMPARRLNACVTRSTAMTFPQHSNSRLPTKW